MKPTHIILSGNDLYAIVAPELVNPDAPDNYKEALEQAIKDGVKFKDADLVKFLPIQQLKPYPIPDGYEVKVVNDDRVNPEWYQPYAILVPKEKSNFFKGGVTEMTPEAMIHYPPKQQSIEEAAEAYKKLKLPDDHYDAFIAGAKSQAAKEYWYEQFKQEKI